ncbi:MAG: sugar phosphate nucleotidyltransferase [Pseudomonadota bacterium]
MNDVTHPLGNRPRCVVMAGGRSSRFAEIGCHKSMAQVRGMPIISHVIDYWKNYTDDFVFVVKNGKEQLTEYVNTLPIRAQFVEPEALRGIADGLSYVAPLVDGPFIMVLGDCFCSGQFEIPPDLRYGILVQRQAEAESIRRNYAVEVQDGLVTRLVEKPTDLSNDYCGMGFYYFQPDIFDYIAKTAPSQRSGEKEITDVLQTLVDHGQPLHAMMFDGVYVNVNTPPDLDLVAAALPDSEA